MQRREMPFEVNFYHRVPLGLGHVGDEPIPQNPRVVDEDVQPSKVLDRLAHKLGRAIPA